MKKINKISIQKWIPIDKIYNNGIIKIQKNKYIKILKINPINYNLKSDLEKKTILNSYKIFLKTCSFDIQILIQSCREDLSQHIFNVEKNTNKKNIQEISKNYIDFIKEINYKKKSSSKNFYLVISNQKSNENLDNFEVIENDLKEKYFKIKECLARCGNEVIEINKNEEIINILFSFLNTRKNI